MYLIFDTETTGLPKDWKQPFTNIDNWPRLVQLAWQLHDETGKLISNDNYIIKPDGFEIPYAVSKVHGITTERANKDGVDLKIVLDAFHKDLEQAKYNVGHNIEFDVNVAGCEFFRLEDLEPLVTKLDVIDTKDVSTEWCALAGGKGGKFKWPTLTELHTKLFGEGFGDAHDAAYDVDATARCFFGLITQNIFLPKEISDPKTVAYEAPKLEVANFEIGKELKKSEANAADILQGNINIDHLEDVQFSHLHCHSQHSILQATSGVDQIVKVAKSMKMPAIALTDHGNMMAAFHFVEAALEEKIKPIVGCEFNLCPDRKDKTKQNNGFQTVILAKNKKGYHNLAKLASYANVEGFYYVPRIDKELLVQYKGELIVTTGGLWGEIPYLIINEGEVKAEEAFLWWKEQFGEDFYIEINRHGIEEENVVNEVLLRFAQKYNVKYVASNNTYYTEKKDAITHDILLCVKDGDPVSKPKKYIGKRGREFRYGFPNEEFYIKSPGEMKQLFADLPEAINTIQEIVDKTEEYKLAREVLLPKFDIPEEFQDERDKEDSSLKIGENNFLKHLTYEGAKKRYETITPEIQERLDFELEVIRNTGYPGYFLIVQDFIVAARGMGVSVGPGRGSAAGSVVAYCTGITNIDPIAYDLLFERFLNPDRVSMPDIDIDFDDEGRGKVMDYVINKYGSNQVAQIITYGTMAAKSSIRDAARVLELPLSDADRIAKLVPDIKLNELFALSDKELQAKLKSNGEQIQMANTLKKIATGSDLSAQILNQAVILEGSVRNTAIHACGVVITPDDITNFVPVALAKDSDMWCTQFDNSVVQSAGLLKMDLLGLKTLTLIKDAVKIVEDRHGIVIDSDTIPLDDVKTYELFQRGETVGIFQYESPAMQKHMRDLKPTVFADLIAMNALYRPGPMKYIPSFIKRKHGEEEIVYDLDDMQEYLEETYGITVYQEQVMLLSQKIAGFTKGEADVLRKAMGDKIVALLDELKPKFINQAKEKGYNEERLEKIWKDWEAFAAYAFNKSHSTCYAWIGYQTAYFKAHYPAEYMASVLSNNMNDIKSVTFFMEECNRMGIKVLGPDVNESKTKFTVNKEGAIRFGLGAVKGSGGFAVNNIIEEREANGSFVDIFDFSERLNLRYVNKKTFESLAMSGGFDCFADYHRRQYLVAPEGDLSLIEKATRYASKMKQEAKSTQVSLFGGASGEAIPRPKVPDIEPYGEFEKLNIEKEVVGLYISGHPLDNFKFELETFCNTPLNDLKNVEALQGKDVRVAGIVSALAHRTTKKGNPFGTLTIEDYNGNHTFFMFGDDYLKFKEFMMQDWYLYVSGRVIKQKWGEEHLVFKISSIELLNDLRSKKSKALEVQIDLKNLDLDMVDQLEIIFQDHKGNCDLRLKIIDRVENVVVDALARKYKINPDNELIHKIDQLTNVKYKVLI